MAVHLDDAGFVRAPAGRCYATLTNLDAWSSWWAGTRTRQLAEEDHVLVTVGRRPRRLRFRCGAHDWRHNAGFHLDLDGDVAGAAEFWLEPGWGGTVVHHLATIEGAAGVVARYRRWVRQGLWGLKDEVQAAVVATT